MTTEQLAEIRARLDAATPRPWVYLGHDTAYEGQVFSVTDGPDGMNMVQVCQEPTGDERPADMELVAHAPTDLAALLAYVRELEGLLRDLCEDSRAVAEVVRLWRAAGAALACLEEAGHQYTADRVTSLRNAVRVLRDAVASGAMAAKKPGGA